jgi:hypothetical protein
MPAFLRPDRSRESITQAAGMDGPIRTTLRAIPCCSDGRRKRSTGAMPHTNTPLREVSQNEIVLF